MSEKGDKWREESRDEARKNPGRYRSGYPNWKVGMDRVAMTMADLERLPEYSGTTPTGVYIDKVWKRYEPGRGWLLGWMREYDPPQDEACLTVFLPIVLAEDPDDALVTYSDTVYAICRECRSPIMRPLREFKTCPECGTHKMPFPVPQDAEKLRLPAPDLQPVALEEVRNGSLVLAYLEEHGGYRLGVLTGGKDGSMCKLSVAGSSGSPMAVERKAINAVWLVGDQPL